MRAAHRETPLTMGNEVELLRDGAATYRAMYQAIRGARHHINMETYIFRDDTIGLQMARLLAQKRQQGVAVNLIYDSVGSMDTPKEFFRQLAGDGVNVLITNAYFVPDERMLIALESAAGAGVEVTLLLPSHSDFWATLYAGRAKYARLLRGGVRIHERKAALLHSKTAVIDGVWSTLGSTNLDRRSLESNDEMDAIVLGRAFGDQMEAMFRDDLQASEAISAERWRQRPLGSRLRELSSVLLEAWL